MSDNLDFSSTYGTMYPSDTSTKLTVYGSSTTIPLNPVRFPNAYLTTQIYDLSNNIISTNGPKLNIYRSIPETRYPFTYIGTPAINNYGIFGQINQSNAPKISVYQQVQGTLVFSYDYTGPLSLVKLASVTYLPIIAGINNALTIVNSKATKNGNRVTVTVNISYINDGTIFGLSFYTTDNNKTLFYNNNATNLSITTLTNFPLHRGGSQFANLTYLTNISNSDSSNTINPTILPNTSLNKCFYLCPSFNSNINSWDVSKVTSMNNMFNGCTVFNNGDTQNNASKPLTNFVTLNVKGALTYMFNNCNAFNQTLVGWDVSNVTNMSNMFSGCTVFNNGDVTNAASKPLTNFVTTSFAGSLSSMFKDCGNFNQIISSWVTSRVTIMDNMFNGCTVFNNGDTQNNASKPLTNFVTTSFAGSLSSMFKDCGNFNQTISSWVTLRVTIMDNMFNGCTVFNNGDTQNNASKPLTNFDTSSVISSLSKLFYRCYAFNQTISSWNISRVTSMDNMFNGCTVFNNGDVTNNALKPFFANCSISGSLSKMFYNCQAFNQTISNWNIRNIENVSYMFYGCTNFNQDIGDWTTGYKYMTDLNVYNGISNIDYMFYGCTNFNQNINNWKVYSRKYLNIDPVARPYISYIYWHGPPNAASGTAGYCPLTPANAPSQLQASSYWQYPIII
jgi:surface protein